MRCNLQTKYGNAGNCFAACVSSLMDMNIEDVPNVETMFDLDECFTMQDDTPLWGRVLDAFIRHHGYIWRPATEEEIAYPPKDKPFLCIGKALDGETNHAVIYMNGKLFHDPNRFRKGLSKILSLQVIERV